MSYPHPTSFLQSRIFTPFEERLETHQEQQLARARNVRLPLPSNSSAADVDSATTFSIWACKDQSDCCVAAAGKGPQRQSTWAGAYAAVIHSFIHSWLNTCAVDGRRMRATPVSSLICRGNGQKSAAARIKNQEKMAKLAKGGSESCSQTIAVSR